METNEIKENDRYVSISEFKDIFERYVAKGLSPELSVNFNSAIKTMNVYIADHKDKRTRYFINVIDTYEISLTELATLINSKDNGQLK